MKTIITLLLLCAATLTATAQTTLYSDVTIGLTSRMQGRANFDLGFALNECFTGEANIMLGQFETFDVRTGASVGLQIGDRPFACRFYAGANYGNFYKLVHLSNGYDDSKCIKAVKPMAGIKLLYGSGAIDLRYTTYDISLTIGFQIKELINFLSK